MSSALLLGLLAGPILLMTVLRINGAMVFLSVCLGSVLLQFVGPDAMQLVSLFSSGPSLISKSSAELTLLLVPVALTAVFMIHSVQGKKVIFNTLPAAAASFLLLLVIKPLLPTEVSSAIDANSWWPQLERLSDLIVSFGALLCIFYLWSQRQKSHFQHKKRI